MTEEEAFGTSKGSLLGNLGGDIAGQVASKALAPGLTSLLGLSSAAIPIIGPLIGLGGMGIQALVGRLTRKGKEKKKATATAEEMHRAVWGDIVPRYQAGEINEKQMRDEINQYEGAYKSYLGTLGDKDVASRSLDQIDWLEKGLADPSSWKKAEQTWQGYEGHTNQNYLASHPEAMDMTPKKSTEDQKGALDQIGGGGDLSEGWDWLKSFQTK
jgi:hypothetical protein